MFSPLPQDFTNLLNVLRSQSPCSFCQYQACNHQTKYPVNVEKANVFPKSGVESCHNNHIVLVVSATFESNLIFQFNEPVQIIILKSQKIKFGTKPQQSTETSALLKTVELAPSATDNALAHIAAFLLCYCLINYLGNAIISRMKKNSMQVQFWGILVRSHIPWMKKPHQTNKRFMLRVDAPNIPFGQWCRPASSCLI